MLELTMHVKNGIRRSVAINIQAEVNSKFIATAE
jgi:hypothetical protein